MKNAGRKKHMDNLSLKFKRVLSFISQGSTLLTVLIITLLSILMLVEASRAATFDVSTKEEFQSALTTAQDNGEDDIINVAAGSITVNGFFQQLEFSSSEAFSLTIKGAGARSTILEGVGYALFLRIVTSHDVTISDMTFKNGSFVAGFGPAVYVEGQNVTIERCIFTENGPDKTIWITINNGYGYIRNNIFSGNKGPGIFVQCLTGLSYPRFSNNTFDGNLGGGIELDGIGDVLIQSNVVWGADSAQGQILLNTENIVALFGNIYRDVNGEPAVEDYNDTSDPMFVANGHWDDNGTPGDTSDDLWVDGDYHLQAGSPCIDSGYYSSATPATDFEGNEPFDDPDTQNTSNAPFFFGDRGAYEYIPTPKVKLLPGTLLLLLSN